MCGLHNGFMMIMMIHVQDPKNNGESPITIILVHPCTMTTMISASRRRPWLFKSGVMSVTPGATQLKNDRGGPMNHLCQKSDLPGASLNRYRQMFVEQQKSHPRLVRLFDSLSNFHLPPSERF